MNTIEEERGTWLLGRRVEDRRELEEMARRLLWFSYRCHFAVPLYGTSHRTDARWGCLARTAQMMVGNGLLRFFTPKSRDMSSWLDGASAVASGGEHVRLICALFLDSPGALFSIHELCREGELLGLSTGSWFGPTVISTVLERLTSSVSQASPSRPAPPVRCLVCQDSSVDAQMAAAMLSFIDSTTPAPLLLLIPTRLGLESVHPVYLPQIAAFLRHPLSMGILGGRQGSSYYFVGASSPSSSPHQQSTSPFSTPFSTPFSSSPEGELYYFDPHTVQTSVSPAALSLEPAALATFQAPRLHALRFSLLDTSLAFGLYCASLYDLHQILLFASSLPPDNPLFSVAWPSSPSSSISSQSPFAKATIPTTHATALSSSSLTPIDDDAFNSLRTSADLSSSLTEHDFALLLPTSPSPRIPSATSFDSAFDPAVDPAFDPSNLIDPSSAVPSPSPFLTVCNPDGGLRMVAHDSQSDEDEFVVL
ncbi:MAG: cysteine protease ATG4 [archaeon]|nr:cysteine protease ATG4 [archaeon]